MRACGEGQHGSTEVLHGECRNPLAAHGKGAHSRASGCQKKLQSSGRSEERVSTPASRDREKGPLLPN